MGAEDGTVGAAAPTGEKDMDIKYLPPAMRPTNKEYLGQQFRCAKCEKEALFDAGAVYTLWVETPKKLEQKKLWFCSVACILDCFEVDSLPQA